MHWSIYLSNLFISVSACGEKPYLVRALIKDSTGNSSQQVLMNSLCSPQSSSCSAAQMLSSFWGALQVGFFQVWFCEGSCKARTAVPRCASPSVHLYCALVTGKCIFDRAGANPAACLSHLTSSYWSWPSRPLQGLAFIAIRAHEANRQMTSSGEASFWFGFFALLLQQNTFLKWPVSKQSVCVGGEER